MTDGEDRRTGGPAIAAHEFFRRGEASAEGWSMLIAKGRGWESAYRDRWRHDKVVRSTHGVNCTGSCSWNVYVKDGLITWESQAVDYPRTDPDRPNHEPRGCPRGASFSWYTYSPVRLKHPYVRGSLLEAWRAAKASSPDPVAAFAKVAADGGYRGERGRGGFFPPLVMGIVKSATGGYGLGFLLMALVAVACLGVLRALAR